MENKKLLSIKKIKVEKLFGIYNYEIPIIDPQLLILYGDNGSGKTTVLRTIFYLLSVKDGSGFKSKLAKIKFDKISILLENDIEIGAQRNDPDSFSYNYYIKQKRTILRTVLLKADEERDIVISNQSVKDQMDFHFIINYLKKLEIHTFYLTDDRKIHSSITSTVKDENDFFDITTKQRDFDIVKKRPSSIKSGLSLDSAVDKLQNWIRNKTIVGSRSGDKASQVIFSDLINNYLILTASESIAKTKAEIIQELDDIDKKIPSYVKLGLIENFETKSLRNSIRKASNAEQIKYLSSIITPFLEGINAKLNALAIVEQTVTQLVEIINDYFSNKKITFNLNSGFQLFQGENIPIDFDWLSSGEKQLLLLLINTISSSDEATIFIIDEPEISLNIKWQRKLIKTLLTFSNNNNIQFIIATHSLELLSANRKNVTKLEDKLWKKTPEQ